jgi:hypothetical protein
MVLPDLHYAAFKCKYFLESVIFVMLGTAVTNKIYTEKLQ